MKEWLQSTLLPVAFAVGRWFSRHAAVVTVLGCVASLSFFSFFWVLTVPIIERRDYPGHTSLVGGGVSSADVYYLDHRTTLKDGGSAYRWWGTKDGEWRRLEWCGRRTCGTEKVLRDSAHTRSWFGIQRDAPDARAFQNWYDKIRKEYEEQSWLLNRVWAWRVH